MKALVTGATGFLGSALLDRLLARGERDIRCFVRTGSNTAHIEALAKRYPDAKIEVFVGSLSSKEGAAKALPDVGVIYHLAASLSGAPADMFLNSVVASKNLLEAVVATGRPIKIVAVSSFGVYRAATLPAGTLIDESTTLEDHPERRDVYSQTKLRQELLFREYQAKHGFPLVVMRPGVIYGEGGSRMSVRVGLDLAGVFVYLGGSNLMPLTFVENCAEAIAVAGQSDAANGQTYNVVDDDILTAKEYLARYQREVKKLHVLPVPYPALDLISEAVVRYNRWSKGQLPAIFTPYKVAAMWKGMRFTNAKLKALGWRPLVSTEEGLKRAFAYYVANPK